MKEFKGTSGKWKYYKQHHDNNSYVVSTLNGIGLFWNCYNSNIHERKANDIYNERTN